MKEKSRFLRTWRGEERREEQSREVPWIEVKVYLSRYVDCLRLECRDFYLHLPFFSHDIYSLEKLTMQITSFQPDILQVANQTFYCSNGTIQQQFQSDIHKTKVTDRPLRYMRLDKLETLHPLRSCAFQSAARRACEKSRSTDVLELCVTRA